MQARYLIIFFLLFSFTWWGFSQQAKHRAGLPEYFRAEQLYREADKLSAMPSAGDKEETAEERLNKQALELLLQVISAKNIPDSFLFQSYVKAGLLYQYFDSIPQAADLYSKAIGMKPVLPAMEDSFFFQPTLFTGSIYYSREIFDSALIFYKHAEQIADRYDRPLKESERLYNRLGAMYFESGNYRLAQNYFKKAAEMLTPANPAYRDLLVNFKMNIAAISVKLEEYEKASELYTELLSAGSYVNQINHNLGIIAMKTGNYAAALSYFRKVKYEQQAGIRDLYYNIAVSHWKLGHKDSAIYYESKAIAENNLISHNGKSPSLGLLYKLRGDRLKEEGQLMPALSAYHLALQQSYPAFNDNDLFSIPERFTGALSFDQLFATLVAKAEAFHSLWIQNKTLKYLEAAFRNYSAAFSLADHIAGTYDSDEARLFLNKIKYAAHHKAIEASLEMFEQTGRPVYREAAFEFDQKNKAAVLTMALRENRFYKIGGVGEELTRIKSAISRLSFKAGRSADPSEVIKLDSSIRSEEIRLAALREKLGADTAFTQWKELAELPTVSSLQKMLDDNTALLSYHLSKEHVLIFYLRKNSFGYVSQNIDSNFIPLVGNYVAALHSQEESARYAGVPAAQSLYEKLLKPLLPQIRNCRRLLIIPDDELNYISFEALQDENKKYLLESFAIQYQSSTALLNLPETKSKKEDVLAFAPFTKADVKNGLPPLPYSAEEVEGLKGNILTAERAVKKYFVAHANSYATVQLATHAAADDAVPSHSYIAFYPEGKDGAENYLYATEIYGLRLDSVNLVILSACETGQGQLVRGEGLMSLTRAFAYAGCPNIITSLWKATDKTTAFITKRLHLYLEKGYTKDRALQQAKLDLLNSNEIPPSLKTPNRWAHLIFIGNYTPAKPSYLWYYVFGCVLLIAGIFFFIRTRSRKMRDRTGGFT